MICIPCITDPEHGPFHDDGSINEAGTAKWLEDGNQFPFKRGTNADRVR